MKVQYRIFLFLILSLANASWGSSESEQQAKNNDGTFAVKKISDGDTFWIYNGTEEGEKFV